MWLPSIYVCVCFITASWDSHHLPAHCALCPRHRSPFSAWVWSDYFLTESAYLERKKMDLPPPRPPRRLNARLFSTETCAHTPRQVHWDGATWLLNIYSSHLSESLVTTSVKLKYKRAVPVSVLEVHLKGTGQISTRCKLYLHTVDCEDRLCRCRYRYSATPVRSTSV